MSVTAACDVAVLLMRIEPLLCANTISPNHAESPSACAISKKSRLFILSSDMRYSSGSDGYFQLFSPLGLIPRSPGFAGRYPSRQCRLDFVLKAFRYSARHWLRVSHGIAQHPSPPETAPVRPTLRSAFGSLLRPLRPKRYELNHVRMDLAVVPLSGLAQAIEVPVIILLSEERGLPVIATLDDRE